MQVGVDIVKRFLAIGLVLVFTAGTASAERLEFRWLDRNKDAGMMGQIERDFKDHIPEDDRSEPLPPGARKVTQVGLYDSSALVILETAYYKDLTPQIDAYRVYSYDTHGRKIVEVGISYPGLQFVTEAHFEPSGSPSTIFHYASCTECEPKEYFETFHYDASEHQWAAGPIERIDQENSEDASGALLGPSCFVYLLRDTKRLGSDQIASSCHEPGEKVQHVVLYSVNPDAPQRIDEGTFKRLFVSSSCKSIGNSPLSICEKS